MQKYSTKTKSLSQVIMKLLPWLFSLLMTFSLVLLVFTFKKGIEQDSDVVTVRKIDVALPLPPPPPPPQEIKQTNADSSPASIDLIGLSGGPTLKYSDTPSLEKTVESKVTLPKFDINSLNLGKTMMVDFPVLEVKSLDRVPTVVSYKFIKPPKAIKKKGVHRIKAKVDLIIDQKGKPHIQKIVDPVYAEMVDVIRKWVKHARFSIPKKDGRPVQAIYSYSINFNFTY